MFYKKTLVNLEDINNLQENQHQIINHIQTCYEKSISKFKHIPDFDKVKD